MAAIERRTHVRNGAYGAAVHDVGGLEFGPIDRHEYDPALWEKRVDAMLILMYAKKQAFKVDGMRRVIEDYGQQAYDSTEYYEKWIRALRNLCLELEIFTVAELAAAVEAARADVTASGRAVASGDVPLDRP
jgi:hypothetical protein